MSITPSRSLLTVVTAVATLLFGGTVLGATVARADAPGTGPVVTLPGTGAAPSTTVAPAPTTTVAPGPPSTAPETRILPAPTTTAPATRILPPPGATTAGDAATTTTIKSTTASTAVPPASLSTGQVDQILAGQVRSGANSTAALLDALTPLQNLGMTADEAAALGMGQFPVQGLANWTDDFGAPRDGPPPHPHQGNDLFTQFNTPVRAPADGTVRFASEDLGGLAAYVTTADGTYYYMAHLNGFATDLASGAVVKQGKVVGYAGDTGNAKGGAPHVHFEIHPGGGAAVDPKATLDGWVAAALAKVPALIASFQPAATADGTGGTDGTDVGIPQILVATGLTRRFSTPPPRGPARPATHNDFNKAVLGPLTPPELAPLFTRAQTDK